MNYKSKRSVQRLESEQKSENEVASSNFFDQRPSTAVQLKQQQIMHAAHSPNVIQQVTAEEEPIQGEFKNETPTQLQESTATKPNNTGLLDNLKSGIENLSGYAMDDVKVHYNSAQPAQLNAHAYAQGTDIHVAPGQEQHLPHEAWHVVQQKQGRVQPTMQMKAGVPVNDDAGLENEADVMGEKALQFKSVAIRTEKAASLNSPTAQLTKTGAGVGALIGGGIGALGFFGGPVVGAITTTAGAAIGGMIGHYLTEPKDFGKFPANKNIDPDKVGEENNGIRELQDEQKRPDDVPAHQNYRLAMHKLHNVILVLESADRSSEEIQSPDTAMLRAKMVSVQKSAKDCAKDYKTGMRNLESDESVEKLEEDYVNSMNQLAQELANYTDEGESVIEEHGYLHGKRSLEKEGTDLWRAKWLKTKRAVDTALTSLWKGWRSTLKTVAKSNKGDASPNTPQNQKAWEQRVDSESWDIFYGGSLMKGYKGPPKQNTRFLASNFDVDANMDAPAVAEFLINVEGKKVDRGQLDPTGSGTRIEEMDNAMDIQVKKELVTSGVVPDAETANKIVSEEFETRVNAPLISDKTTKKDAPPISDAAKKEIKRSEDEQQVRDKLTGVRKLHPEKMTAIGDKLREAGLFKDNSLDVRPLKTREIIRVRAIINDAIK